MNASKISYFLYYSFDVNFDVNKIPEVLLFFQIIHQTAYNTYDFKGVKKSLWLATSQSYLALYMYMFFFSTWCTSFKAAWDIVEVFNSCVLCLKRLHV